MHTSKIIDRLEMTQCRAASFVKMCHIAVTDHLLQSLLWCMILVGSHYRPVDSITGRLCYHKWYVELPTEYHPTPCNHSTHGHSKQFQCFQPEVDLFKYAFLPRSQEPYHTGLLSRVKSLRHILWISLNDF